MKTKLLVTGASGFMNDLITVGITVFQYPERLQRTLDQITSQTYKNLEIIISNNNPENDECDKIAKAFAERDPRIRYYHQSKNLGINDNALFLVGKATGKYYVWAADDEWEPTFIESLYREIQKTKSVCVMSRVTHVMTDGSRKDLCDFDKYILPDYHRYGLAIYAAGHDTMGYYLFGLWKIEPLKKYIYRNFTAIPGDDNIMMAEVILSEEIGFVNQSLHTHYEYWHTVTDKERLKLDYRDVWFRFFYLFRYNRRLLLSNAIPVKRKVIIPILFMRMAIRTAQFYFWHYPSIGIQILLKNRDLYKTNQ